MKSPQRILVARGGAIGDFVLTLPVFQALRERWPDAWIEVLGYPRIASLGTVSKHCDRITRVESPLFTPLFGIDGQIPGETRAFLSEFDLILSYLHDPDRHFERRVQECTEARFLRGTPLPSNTSTSHAARVLLRPLSELGLTPNVIQPRILCPTPASALPLSERYLVCHPGSGSPTKNWPLDHWLELIQWLLDEAPWRLAVVGGEADHAQLARIRAVFSADRVSLWEGLPLPELAVRLAQAAGFIGHDSGISHLAAAVGAPVRALWGWTNADVWQPLGEDVRLVHAPEGLAKLDTETVIQEVGDLLHRAE